MASMRAHRSLAGGARQAVTSIRGWQLWTLRPVVKLYLLGVVGLDWAVTVIALVVGADRVSLSHLGLYLALVVCGFVAVEASRPVPGVKGTISRDLLGVWSLTAAILFPAGFALLSPLLFEAYRMTRVGRVILHRRVFSSATVSLGFGAASIVFHAAPASIAGPAPQPGGPAAAWLLLAAGCNVLAWAVNNGLVLAAIRLATPEVRLREAFGGRIGWVFDVIELSASVTVAFVVGFTPAGIILALPPVLYFQRLLMNAQLVSQTRVDAESGALSGVLWRYEAEVEVVRARRKRRPLSVALAEIDDFAGFGGAAGPEAERQVLRAVAAMLAGQVPAAAQVGRLRGSQFAVVLPGVPEDEARRLGVRIRDHVAAELVEVERDGQLGFGLRPTVSVGVAGLSEDRQTVTELIVAADEALAKARASGGNQVSVAPAGPGVAQASAG
jgi:diguanylate cyclase (GGDEF)-like protein